MNGFDRTCAGAAFVVGVALVGLGILGLIFGCNAQFSLPPVLGVLPALVGWGIVRTVRIAWKQSAEVERQRWKSSRIPTSGAGGDSPPGA